ncbi:MAG: InlB B-repeat-containing protein [Treponema sp.]|nr:InlB B-repeat-containing protein [Treponema sp.]
MTRSFEMKKGTAAFALSIAVLSFILFSGCEDFFNPSKQKHGANVPAGMGTFTLQIEGAGSQSRVIMPVTDTLVFEGYTLVFTDTAGVLAPQSFYLSETNKGNPVALEAATYDLEVTAYTEYTSPSINTPAAKGGVIDIEIPAGGDVGGTVTLNAIINGEGNGTFSWDIDFSLQISEAWMEISSQTDPGFSPVTKHFISLTETPVSNPGNMTLPSGHYRVTFTLEEDSNHRQVIWRETLHVYENLTSHFEHDFTDYIFIKQSYSLTLTNLYSPAGSLRPDEISTYFYDDVLHVTNPTRPSWIFDGWYTDEYFTTGNEWDGTLSADTILYAKWLDIPILVFNPSSVNFIMAKDSLVLPSPVTVTLENSGSAAATITSIALSGADDSYFQLSGHSSITSIAAGSDDAFDVTVITQPPSVVATYTALVTVSYSGNDGPKAATANIVFSVTDFLGTMPASQKVLDSRDLVHFSGTGDQYGRYMKTVSGEWIQGEMDTGEAVIELTYGAEETLQNNNSLWSTHAIGGGVGSITMTRLVNGNPNRAKFNLELNVQHNSFKVTVTADGNLYLDNNGSQGSTVSAVEITSYEDYFWIATSGSNIKFKFEIGSDAGWVYEEFYPNPYPVFRQDGVTIYYWRFDGSSGIGPGMWSWGDTYFGKFDPPAVPILSPVPDTVIFNTDNFHDYDFFTTDHGGTDLMPGNIDYAVLPGLGDELFELRIGSTVIGNATVAVTNLNGYNTTNGNIASVDISVTYNLNPAFLPLIDSYTSNITTDTHMWNSASPGSHTHYFAAKPYGPMTINTVFTFK